MVWRPRDIIDLRCHRSYGLYMLRPTDVLRLLVLTALLLVAPLRVYAQMPEMAQPDTAHQVSHAAAMPSDAPCSHGGADDCSHASHHPSSPHCSNCLHISFPALPSSSGILLPRCCVESANEPTTRFSSITPSQPIRPPQLI